MLHNIHAGRLRDYIEIYDKSQEQNDYGELIDAKTLVFDAMANCSSRSSSESVKFGYTAAESIITVLMWYDERLTNKMVITWNSHDYEIIGMPQPDDLFKSMIVTMKRIVE